MKESEFIEQNKKKWLHFEENLQNKVVNPEITSKLFVQITDDLSYAQTFYKNRSVKIYLNGVAKLLFNDINKSKQNRITAFIHFWKTDLPLTMYISKRAMLISFIVFTCCFILGVITSIHDHNFASTILSRMYVDMTNENIAKGDAMAVYKSKSELETFLPILLNNITIDFLTFFSGIFFAIGSLLIMIVNGVMVGVFQYFFIEKHLFWESFLAIWTHGTLEISAIILSGGAGLTLGKGLLFPGTYSRFQAFRISGINGLKIIMGVVPITLLAAFIEGFLTRHTDIPDAIRFSFILLSFSFIIIYFFWYPRKVAKQTQNIDEVTEFKPVYKPIEIFNPSEILNFGKIFTETVRQFLKYFAFFGTLIIVCSFVLALIIATDSLNLFHINGTSSYFLTQFFSYEDYPLLAVISDIFFIVVIVSSLLFIKRKLINQQQEVFFFKSENFVNTLNATILSTLLFIGLMIIGNGWFIALAFILFPLLIFLTSIVTNQNSSFFKAINLSGRLLNRRWSIFISLTVAFTFICGLLYLTTTYVFKRLFIQDALMWMLTSDEIVAENIFVGLSVFQISFSFLLYIILMLISSSILFYTLKESYTAENLIYRINNIKATK